MNRMAQRFVDVQESDLIGRTYKDMIRQGLYDTSVVGVTLRTKTSHTVRAKALRTGIETISTGIPHLDKFGDVCRIVTRETLVEPSTLDEVVRQSEEISRRLDREFDDPYLVRVGSYEVVARNLAYRQVLRTGFTLASKGISRILILGESGCGKGFLARLFHEKSPRSDAAFVQINCAAVPDNLLEAELFGYEAGAFTGARPDGKEGLLELSSGGTLFLDEIGEMPLTLQAKLLKVLDDFQVTRLGGVQPRKVDCTLLCATNADLKEKVKQGTFREDLYYRINAFSVSIPPLRERPEDILGLFNHYVDRYNKRFNMERCLSSNILEQIQHYAFPGNVRELKNIAMRLVVLGDTSPFDAMELPEQTKRRPMGLKERMNEFERELLLETMMMYPTTRSMAEHLLIDQSSVVRKLQKYGLKIR